MLAPVALALFAVVFLIVLVTSLGGDSGSESHTKTTPSASAQKRTTPVQRRGLPGTTGKRFYIVKPGDTLSKIAAKTGVEIDRLLALNPTIDPHALVSGQRIKLRE
jgi:LysM repeat protein